MSRSACSAFVFLSPVANKYLTVKVSKQSDLGALIVYKNFFSKTMWCQTKQRSEEN